MTVITPIDENCVPGMDGGATASTSGGTPPYTYTWPNTPSGIQTNDSAQGLTAGVFHLFVMDIERGNTQKNSIYNLKLLEAKLKTN